MVGNAKIKFRWVNELTFFSCIGFRHHNLAWTHRRETVERVLNSTTRREQPRIISFDLNI